MRIAFMGTPEFAVPSLRRLHDSDHEIVLVVTQPDRRAGRGRALRSPPVKLAAESMGLPLEQHETVNTDAFAEHLRELDPDLLVVAAFGQILREDILGCPRLGAINVHASLLPSYRGVAPINWAIIDGAAETGVTTMFMARKVDAGEIILTRSTPIGETETAGELYDRLAELGAGLLLETLERVERGDAPRSKQNPDAVSYARKLTRSDGEIDWTARADHVCNRIRGTTPWPGAYTWYRGKMLHVLEAAPGRKSGRAGEPGEVLAIDELRGVEVAAGEGSVWLWRLRPEGRSEMDGASFARGYRPEVGSRPFARQHAME
ncbi:MAG: methionyl-tRNA formyltransferase [Candidatus Eisenbacteria bacterium]|nr:methionyl-tRNA formyltransferase [Candidatus Eisenbacteria bacterium]